jgi:hypothetical protein
MDAVFYTDDSRQFYGDRAMTVTLSTSGANPGGTIQLKYTQLGKELGVLSWERYPFFTAANEVLNVDNFPVQFSGSTVETYGNFTIWDATNLVRLLGVVRILPGVQRVVFQPVRNQTVGAIGRPVANRFDNATTYELDPGCVLVYKQFS